MLGKDAKLDPTRYLVYDSQQEPVFQRRRHNKPPVLAKTNFSFLPSRTAVRTRSRYAGRVDLLLQARRDKNYDFCSTTVYHSATHTSGRQLQNIQLREFLASATIIFTRVFFPQNRDVDIVEFVKKQMSTFVTNITICERVRFCVENCDSFFVRQEPQQPSGTCVHAQRAVYQVPGIQYRQAQSIQQ